MCLAVMGVGGGWVKGAWHCWRDELDAGGPCLSRLYAWRDLLKLRLARKGYFVCWQRDRRGMYLKVRISLYLCSSKQTGSGYPRSRALCSGRIRAIDCERA